MAKQYDSKPTIEYLKSRCNMVGDCWEWTGRMRAGVPWVYLHYRINVPARWAAHNIANGNPPDQKPLHGRQATIRCLNHACINPAHIVMRTKRDAMRAWAEVGSYSDPAKAAKVKATMIAKSKLPDSAVREIRESTESAVVLAERHGIHPHYVSDIRLGRKRGETHGVASVFSWRP